MGALALLLMFWPGVVSCQPRDESSEALVEVFYALQVGGEELVYAIPQSTLDEAPRWNPEEEPLPLAIRDVVQIGREHLRASGSTADHLLRAVGLQSVPGDNRAVWYYMLEFYSEADPWPFYPDPDYILVLLDGTVLPPTPRKRVDFEARAASNDPERQFQDLPPTEMIERASAILLVEYQEDGDKLKAVVSEVLKRRSGTTLHYGIGHEFDHLSRAAQGDQRYGDGMVVFLVGPQADMRTSYPFFGEQIFGFGEMSLGKLRELAADD